YIIIVLLFFLSISTIYYYGPAVKNKFRFISPGSTFATIVSILASIIFSAYVGGIDRYNTVYGIFGTIIIFLTWMYINAFVLLIGFELNASIYYKREENDREKSLRADFLAEESAEI
ncbi:MAG: YihY/virulence factor BrkB family protein, partial [Chitinophagales bacterium]